MAITYPLDVPLEEFAQVDVEPVDVNALQISTFTGQERLQTFEGDYWKVTLRYRDLDRDLGRPVQGFVQALRKSFGTFVVRYPGYGTSRGQAATVLSSPLVNGDGQAGNRVLNVKSAPASVSNWLVVGDVIQVGPDTRPHWHTVLSDVTTDSSGNATIDIWPAVRNTTVNNDIIVTETPRGLCRLLDTVNTRITTPTIYGLELQCREVTS